MFGGQHQPRTLEMMFIASRGEAPEDEHWKFSPGQLVRCRQQKLSGGDCLVAYESATI